MARNFYVRVLSLIFVRETSNRCDVLFLLSYVHRFYILAKICAQARSRFVINVQLVIPLV